MKTPSRPVRYAVVGLGHIAQMAVLPAFAHARKDSELIALVSGDPKKLATLGRRYRVPHAIPYQGFDDLAASGLIDAVYLALPNDLHRDWTTRAAQAGLHVLCEKPLAVTERDARFMVDTAREAGVLLMTAYRLHFEPANLGAIKLIKANRIGDPRIFVSSFTMQVADPDNIRLRPEHRGGGPLYDLGVYCINAARSLFADEPTEVSAHRVSGPDPRFKDVGEMVAATLRFPGERLASFTCSFGAADSSQYRVIGTKGEIMLEPAYDYSKPLSIRLTVKGKQRKIRFARVDQFAAELSAFSKAVRRQAEAPSTIDAAGLADIRVIEALLRSSVEGRAIALPPFAESGYPDPRQETRRPPVKKPETVGVAGPRD